MGANTKIQWAHHTFNPWRGCTKVSGGCAHWYAETQSKRNPGVLGVWGPHGKRIVASEDYWRQPLKWNEQAKREGERKRVFCASLADIGEDKDTMPFDSWDAVTAARARLSDLIQRTPWLDWLLLTKRPENLRRVFPEQVLHQCWVGTSVEDQAEALNRVPHLQDCPAKVRFLSCEPLLGGLRLSPWLEWGEAGPPWIDWVIVGGESGKNARACGVAWVESIVQQCADAGAACFVKQLGSRPIFETFEQADRWPNRKAVQLATNRPDAWLSLKDSKGGDPGEWPEHLRVRELPEVE